MIGLAVVWKPDITDKGYSRLGSTPIKREPCKCCRPTASQAV